MTHIDTVTGKEADAYTPPENRRRTPNTEVETYVLGTYEQMIVDKAIAFAIRRSSFLEMSDRERADLRALVHIFEASGQVTITRDSEPQS